MKERDCSDVVLIQKRTKRIDIIKSILQSTFDLLTNKLKTLLNHTTFQLYPNYLELINSTIWFELRFDFEKKYPIKGSLQALFLKSAT